jgi:uncharacterized membrane protein
MVRGRLFGGSSFPAGNVVITMIQQPKAVLGLCLHCHQMQAPVKDDRFCCVSAHWALTLVLVVVRSVAAANSFVAHQTNASAAADISAAWSTFCSSTLQRNSSLCAKVADSISRSHAGNFGKRAGAVCLGLGGKASTK